MGHGGQPRARRAVAPTEAEQVHHDEPMSRSGDGQLAHDTVPQMRRSREPVQEHYRLTRSARSGGIVVQPAARDVHELTAHGGKMDAERNPNKLAPGASRARRVCIRGAKTEKISRPRPSESRQKWYASRSECLLLPTNSVCL